MVLDCSECQKYVFARFALHAPSPLTGQLEDRVDAVARTRQCLPQTIQQRLAYMDAARSIALKLQACPNVDEQSVWDKFASGRMDTLSPNDQRWLAMTYAKRYATACKNGRREDFFHDLILGPHPTGAEGCRQFLSNILALVDLLAAEKLGHRQNTHLLEETNAATKPVERAKEILELAGDSPVGTIDADLLGAMAETEETLQATKLSRRVVWNRVHTFLSEPVPL